MSPVEGHQDIELSATEDACLSAKRKKERSLKVFTYFSNRHKKERVRDIKDFLIRCANHASHVGSAEHKSQCEHVLGDVIHSLWDGKDVNKRMNNYDATVDNNTIQSNMNYEDADDELSRFFFISNYQIRNFVRQKSYCLSIEVRDH